TGPAGGLHPRPDIGIVIEPADHHFIARGPPGGQGSGKAVGQGCHVRPENDPIRLAAGQVASAARHPAVIPSERLLAGNAPPALPSPARYASPIASITVAGSWVPAAPSR